MSIIIETERLILKPVQVSDAEAIFHFFTPNVTTYMYPAPAKAIDDTLQFINYSIKMREEQKEIVWVARLKYDDRFVGCMGLHKINTKTPELGIWIQEGLFGKKLGLEGMTEIVKYSRTNVVHDYLVYPVDRRNKASRNIPETLGGIYQNHYKKISQSGFELDIIEYFIYPTLPKNYKKEVILFQGDSITDCGRNRNDLYHLGDGYVSDLKESFPNQILINKGISGDRTEELMNRWDEDVIIHKPDILTLLCGVNDVWHYYHFGKPIDKETFKSNYIKLIEQTRSKLPQTMMALIEPFSFQIGAFHPTWRPMLDEFIEVVRMLAKTYDLPLIKMDDHMKSWEKTYGREALLGDGVHPTELGHQMIAHVLKPVLRDLVLKIQIKRNDNK